MRANRAKREPIVEPIESQYRANREQHKSIESHREPAQPSQHRANRESIESR
jgi:hypothetical protein